MTTLKRTQIAVRSANLISAREREVLKKVAAGLWEKGHHVFDSQWMRNPKLDHFVCVVLERSKDGTGEMGYVTVNMEGDVPLSVHVLYSTGRITFLPEVDFSNW